MRRINAAYLSDLARQLLGCSAPYVAGSDAAIDGGRWQISVTTRTVECAASEDDSEDGAVDSRECTSIREETTVSHRPPKCHGVLSCSFCVAGEAIALPFRGLGTVLDVVL